MTGLWLARGGLVALVAMATTVRAGEAFAQGAGAGKQLELAGLGVRVTMPAGIGEWIARQDDGGDVLQRTRPVNPYLSVLFSVPEGAGGSCGETMAGLAKKGLRKLDRPALVPPGWSPQVLAAAANGETLVAFCAEPPDGGGDGQLLALVTYASSVDGPDLSAVTPLLEAVAEATFARPSAEASRAEPERGDDDDASADGEDPPQQLALPRSGLVLLVGGAARWEARAGKNNRDLVRRTSPAGPALSIAFEIVRAARKDDGGCSAMLQQYMATRARGVLEESPGYLPDEGFHTSAVESYTDGQGRALACAEIASGYLLATVAYAGSLGAEDARAARPVLTAAYLAADGLSAAKPRRARRASGRRVDSAEVFLGAGRLAPRASADPDGLLDDGTGFVGGVRQAGMLPFGSGSAFGLAGRFQLTGGWDTRHGLMLDGTLALGLGVAAGPLKLMPMVGGGGDAIGAGRSESADTLRMPFELYRYYAVVLVAELGDRAGIELTGALADRGGRDETRVDGKLIYLPRSFRKLSLGLGYLEIARTATIWQLLIGVGF